MRPKKIDFRFLFYTQKKHTFKEKIYIFKCQFTRKIPKNLVHKWLNKMKISKLH